MHHPMVETLQKNMTAITASLDPATMEALGAKNIKPVSARTLQFDCTPKADGTNRVKITIENGTFQVRGYKVEETDLLYCIPAANLQTAVQNLGSALPNIPTTF